MRKRNRGLTLIELVMALLIATLLLFSLFQIFTSGFRYQMQSRNSSKILSLAEKVMESVRMDVLNASVPIPPYSETSFPSPDGDYLYSADIYTYQTITIPQPGSTAEDTSQRRYIAAVKVNVRGPIRPGGGAGAGYREESMLSLVAARKYMGPAEIAPAYALTVSPPPPTPMDQIILPPTPNP